MAGVQRPTGQKRYLEAPADERLLFGYHRTQTVRGGPAAVLGAIVESSDDAIISKTVDGIITSWNRGAKKLFGYSAKEAVGQPMMMLIPPERADGEPAILRRIARGE